MEFDGEIERLKSIEDKLHSKLEASKAALVEAEALASDRLDQLKERDFVADRLRSTLLELNDIQAQLDIAKKETEIIAIQTRIKVTAELMCQFKAGKTGGWDPEAAFADERKLQLMIDREKADVARDIGLAGDFGGISVADYPSDEQPKIEQLETD